MIPVPAGSPEKVTYVAGALCKQCFSSIYTQVALHEPRED
jgi:hypothetical protein